MDREYPYTCSKYLYPENPQEKVVGIDYQRTGMEPHEHLAQSLRQVDGIFRGILAGKPVAGAPLTAEGESSTRLLNEAADVLCATEVQRKLLQMVYDLGGTDGALRQAQAALAALAKVPA